MTNIKNNRNLKIAKKRKRKEKYGWRGEIMKEFCTWKNMNKRIKIKMSEE